MKSNKKLAVAIASFACAFTCLVGGTYAWYVVSNTAATTFNGHTAQASEGLVFGVLKKEKTAFAADEDVTWNVETDDATEAKTTPLNLNAYVPQKDETNLTKGFAPVTSGSYKDGDTLKLKAAPTYDNAAIDQDAKAELYGKFTLVFKTKKQNAEIYLNEAMTSFEDTSTGTSVLNSLRIAFDSTTIKSIYSPSKMDAAEYKTNVGGRMDLNGDSVWDYKYTAAGGYEEVYYGEADGEITTTNTTPADAIDAVTNTNKDPLKGKSVKKNQYMTSMKYIESATAKTQTAHGSKYFVYDSTSGASNHPIAKANQKVNDYYYASLTVTIWLEGWDPSCKVDFTDGKDFSYNLGFVAPALISSDGQQF